MSLMSFDKYTTHAINTQIMTQNVSIITKQSSQPFPVCVLSYIYIFLYIQIDIYIYIFKASTDDFLQQNFFFFLRFTHALKHDNLYFPNIDFTVSPNLHVLLHCNFATTLLRDGVYSHMLLDSGWPCDFFDQYQKIEVTVCHFQV